MAPREGGTRKTAPSRDQVDLDVTTPSSTPDPTARRQSPFEISEPAEPQTRTCKNAQPHESSNEDTPRSATPSAGSNADHNELQLVARIQSAIEYAQSPEPHALASHNQFNIAVTDPPSAPLRLLRKCTIATLISSSPTNEVYALPIPIAPPALRAPSEQWWAGLSPAEIRAGPVRDDEDVKRAEHEVKSKAERRRNSLKTKKGVLKLQKEYMRESLRRQTLHLPMEGAISRKAEEEAMEKYGQEWENFLGELDEEEDDSIGAGERGAVDGMDGEAETEHIDLDGEGESGYTEWLMT
ncbi:hypothetical protein PSPO01_07572 [Paraphaeosphaeria sporulosa]